MIRWIKNLFHTHEIMWTSRRVIEKTSVDYTMGGVVDIEPATKYLYSGYCCICKECMTKTAVIAEIFDMEQPYDVKEKDESTLQAF